MTERVAIEDDDRFSGWLDGTLDEASASAIADGCARDQRWVQARDELDEVRTLVRALEVAEPPAGFLESLVEWHGPAESRSSAAEKPIDIRVMRTQRRRTSAAVTVCAAAAAAVMAFVVPSLGHARPALASEIRVHQAGLASSGDPVSGLAPLGTGMKFGK